MAKSGTFIQLSGALSGPDRLALDAEDNLAVCHMGLGLVWLFGRLGEPVLRARSPAVMVTSNCAYGGPGNRTFYITEVETASTPAVEMPAPGKPMHGLS